jgi:hypothetical protein
MYFRYEYKSISQNRSVGEVTCLRVDDKDSISRERENFLLSAITAYSASYPKVTGGFAPGGKGAGTWNKLLISIQSRD